GVISQKDGSFSLQASPGNTLVISVVGYQTKEVQLGSSARLRIVMEQLASSLTDIVVVGYGTQKKASVTGALSAVKSEDLVRTPATTTSAALVGKMPGITSRAVDSR